MRDMEIESREKFPWHLGVHDAHCHPTDINASLTNVPNMKTQTLTIMATRISDQSLVDEAAEEHNKRIVPAFGHHPWFAHLVYDDTRHPNASIDLSQRAEHFKSVLQPPPTDDEIGTWLTGAGDVIALSALIAKQRDHLLKHSTALIGEVGLDRASRIPEPWPNTPDSRKMERTEGSREGRRLAKQRVSIDHQRKILAAQMALAGELERGVSVHGVQAHGVLFDFFKQLWKGHEIEGRQKRKKAADNENALPSTCAPPKAQMPFPPRICLHSYSGSVENLKQYFSPRIPSEIYASFSIAVNFNIPDSPAAAKAEEVIKWIPADKLLIESDLHRAGADMDDMMELIARKVCHLRGWTLDDGVAQLAANYKRFIALPE